MSGLPPESHAALSRIVRLARARLCVSVSPAVAYQRLQDAVSAKQSGLDADPPWLNAALSEPVITPCWSDPSTAGWVHQAFHAADLAAINAHLEDGGLLTGADLARKTQLFTDRYMIDWLIDNSLGVLWGTMCAARGWKDTAAWPYRVQQPDAAREHLPAALADLRILDPACGTGNFLMVLLERLLVLYRLEASLQGRPHSDAESAEQIIAHNLVGVDIDTQALGVARRLLRGRAVALGATVSPQLIAAPAPAGALGPVAGEGCYHLVIGNPPYLSARLMAPDLQAALPPQSPDLYAAFLRRGLTLCAPGGVSAMVTMRGWLFTHQFQSLRQDMLQHRIGVLGDLAEGAFAELSGSVVSVVMSTIWRLPPDDRLTVVAAHQGTPLAKQAALRAQDTRHEIAPSALAAVPGQPLLYWWAPSLLRQYQTAPLLGEHFTLRQGMATGHNARFLRRPWEVHSQQIWRVRADEPQAGPPDRRFVPYVKGAAGREWIEGLSDVIDWERSGMQVKIMHESRYGSWSKRIPSAGGFFQPAACFTKIGARFSARIPRYRSIFDVAGSAVFAPDPRPVACLLNSLRARQVLQDLNPTVNFQIGDVARLPLLPITHAAAIYARLEDAWSSHAAVTETSPEFVRPGDSPWVWACQWAQAATDRPAGAALPRWSPAMVAPTAADHLSFAVRRHLQHAPHGVHFLSGVGDSSRRHEPLLAAAWAAHALGPSLHDWLRLRFFSDHLRRYANRPIIFPLSSAKKTFVALVSIHRWTNQTLPALLRDHLHPLHHSLRDHPARDELRAFTAAIEQLAAVGPSGREVDAPFVPELSDGVLVTSAALWPVLHPQWKAPKKWWAAGSVLSRPRSFAWSALARRYFPSAVEARCRQDASLCVAHGCLAEHHPEVAARWGVSAPR